jgi:hypothetical protein
MRLSVRCAREWERERAAEKARTRSERERERGQTLRLTLRLFSFDYVASSLASLNFSSFIFISGDVYEFFHTMTCAFFSL